MIGDVGVPVGRMPPRACPRSQAERNALALANRGLVGAIARGYGTAMSFEDLFQEGMIGLIMAAERYEPGLGRFSTYAAWWIRHAICRALADKGRTVRLPVHVVDARRRLAKQEARDRHAGRASTTEELAAAVGMTLQQVEQMQQLPDTTVSLDSPICDDDDLRLIDTIPAPGAASDDAAESGWVWGLVGGLPPLEADVVALRYAGELELGEIGARHGLPRKRVRQILARALSALRRAAAGACRE